MQPENDAREILIGIYQILRGHCEQTYEAVAASTALTKVLASNQTLHDMYRKEKNEADQAFALARQAELRCIDEAIAVLRGATHSTN
jgi:hypothetical protein